MPQQLTSVEIARQQRDNLIEVILALLRRVWGQLDAAAPVASYSHHSGTVTAQVIAAQIVMARLASTESESVLRELGIEAPPVGQLVPSAFVGKAADGRTITSLLELPARTIEFAQIRGAEPQAAMDAGLLQMERIISTELVDTNRAAMQVEVAQRPTVTRYVRMLTLPSCSRCVILAGRIYRWNADFLRHPACDCVAVPATEDVAGDLRTDPEAALRAGQVTGMSKADRRAVLEHGADLNRVVNVRRLEPLGWAYGSSVNRRFTARGSIVPTPAEILRTAKTREAVIEQLTRSGYMVDRRRHG